MRNTLFLSVGTTLIVFSFLLELKGLAIPQAIALNLGLVSIAVVILDYLWRLSGGSPIENQIESLGKQIERLSKAVDVIERSKTIGLEAVYDRLGNYGNQSNWVDLIKDSVESVDLMGRTMFGWTRSTELIDVILTKIEHDNVTFRWLIMHKDNKYLPLLTEEDVNIGHFISDKLHHVYKTLWEVHQRLPDESKSRFQVRTFSHVPLYCSILRVDDQHFVTQYLFSSSSDSSPLYCVRGKDAAWPKIFAQEFTAIWDMSHEFFSDYAELSASFDKLDDTHTKSSAHHQ
ncbi:MAG: hypothetical protein JWM21_3469 [Acidobacteria bacterium]|nr:hypothetical protein [Acidobacteriota bacterium]